MAKRKDFEFLRDVIGVAGRPKQVITPVIQAPPQIHIQKRYFVGLDLGLEADHSAVCVLEGGKGPVIRELRRMPLGRLYSDVAADVADLAAKLGPCIIGADGTGVGRPVLEMLQAKLPSTARMFGIIITSGHKADWSGNVIHVPKRELVSTLTTALHAGSLKLAAGIEHAALLRHELSRFSIKAKHATGTLTYEAWRDADHDDLVLAACISAWLEDQLKPTVVATISDRIGKPVVNIGGETTLTLASAWPKRQRRVRI